MRSRSRARYQEVDVRACQSVPALRYAKAKKRDTAESVGRGHQTRLAAFLDPSLGTIRVLQHDPQPLLGDRQA